MIAVELIITPEKTAIIKENQVFEGLRFLNEIDLEVIDVVLSELFEKVKKLKFLFSLNNIDFFIN